MTHYVLIGLAVLIVILTVVAVLDLLPPLRIVRDDAQRRQQPERCDHGENGNENAKPDENVVSHGLSS